MKVYSNGGALSDGSIQQARFELGPDGSINQVQHESGPDGSIKQVQHESGLDGSIKQVQHESGLDGSIKQVRFATHDTIKESKLINWFASISRSRSRS